MSSKHLILIITVLLALLVSGSASTAVEKGTYISVHAGQWDRIDTVVSFEFPGGQNGFYLRDETGSHIPLQLEGTTASFILRDLKAGQTKRFRVVPPLPNVGRDISRVELTRVKNRLEVRANWRQVLSFVSEPAGLPATDIKTIFLRGGYIHPVFTPGGRIVTDDYPSDHYHHHGIWFAWTKTEFEAKHPDFWNMGDGTGRVEFEKVGRTWTGPVQGGFTSFQKYVALTGPTPKTALKEEWEVRVYNVAARDPYFIFDIVATQEAASTSPLILEEYRYGGMAVRGHRDWKDKSKVSFLTSEGKTRIEGNAARSRWCHIGGPVDGQIVGMAVLDHPSNFRAPAPLRIHPDDPYFNYAPSQLGRFQIDPGKKFVLRYRYVVADGPPDAKQLDRLWNDYANPPQVSIQKM